MRVFDTNELCMKFSRGLDSAVIDFLFLSEDYKKLVFLQTDRFIEFHAQGGRHHRIRIPKEGRALEYCPTTAELLVVGSTNEIYRLDLELGEFEVPWESKSEALNFCIKNPVLPLVCAGGSEGLVECWDTRVGNIVATLQVTQDDDDNYNGKDITCGAFSDDGIKISVGTCNGIVRIYDIRSNKIMCEKNHKNTLPIKNIQWIDSSHFIRHSEICGLSDIKTDGCRKLISSCDSKSIKIYESMNGEMFTTIENVAHINDSDKNCLIKTNVGVAINDYVFYPNSGLCFVANEQKRLGVFFLPAIGVAPKWCSFLESITEELEDNKQTKKEGTDNILQNKNEILNNIYDDYKFFTREQLEQLGVSNLIGTPLLRAYMHGFFMDAQLFRKIKSVAEPFAYEEYRKAKIREKLEAKKSMRIAVKQNIPKVNKELAEKLQSYAKDVDKFSKKKQKIAKQAENILKDNRFSRIFMNPEFAIENININEQPQQQQYADDTDNE